MTDNLFGTDLFGEAAVPAVATGALADRFVMPPFSVLDARGGAWLERKDAWRALGIRAAEGRTGLGDSSATEMSYFNNGKTIAGDSGSMFDPVLCELMYRWFCPAKGRVLDPFAGEMVKGAVAAYLGFRYTGIELRAEQVGLNQRLCKRMGLAPTFVCGDSTKLDQLLAPEARFDFVWTSPPYYNLEVYSSKERDGSTLPSFEAFMQWYEGIFALAVARLQPNRFLAVKVGEVREPDGTYTGFVPANVACFRRLGLTYYNELVMATPVGSAMLRATRQFNGGRKVVKTHQNILVFCKGDWKKAAAACMQSSAAWE